MDNLALEEKIRALRQFKRMAEELQAQITGVEDEIKGELTRRETEEDRKSVV